jgi:O-antigen/teichoic acid export membrane protein
VSFPRLARSSAPVADELAERSCRYGLAAAVAAAAVLAVATPILLPVVFGEAYAPAVAPAVVLVFAYVVSSAQWLLGRAAAARGNPGILVWSYGANLVVMAGLDLVLIPAFGITGAAVASAAGALVGAAVIANDYRRRGTGLAALIRFLPRGADFRVLARIPRAALPRTAPPPAVVAPPPPE